MSKKKIQHKGKPKQATQENEDILFKRSPNVVNIEEEYTTVADYEMNKKYNKRLIESNWAKYETSLLNSESNDDEIESHKIDDFSSLLKTASSDCSHFQFSSEKLWKTEENITPSSDIFNLDLNILSNGLACVPFHKRINLDENEVSVEDKKIFDKSAAKSWENYNNIIRNFKETNNENDNSKLNLQNKTVKISEKVLEVKTDLNSVTDSSKNFTIEGSENVEEVVESGKTSKSENIDHEQVDKLNAYEKNDNKVPKNKFLTENDENLEDWLDSVLDD